MKCEFIIATKRINNRTVSADQRQVEQRGGRGRPGGQSEDRTRTECSEGL